ncbi:protein of unknown function [Taphrina deformans PYCC 5710]|uniref:Uncharacterized protein n=1 Tax=Taphrina deformans (strain PYCC 5710 / ATCC 11124 / CBS 356.35 / IMI 108563 / JCM 9778 / NBRC 8474) TaxID=1097556 RepID=R4X9N7_TAPDE|nr:protein of unknown function [Taphrina deformans PYCC 5710]|eukprot:CCG82145.1 protein of unknown function [Taphrina deformans PYCC 5710]
MSTLPITGFAYAVNGKFTPRSSRAPSQTASPPPEYNVQSTTRLNGAENAKVVTANAATIPGTNPDAAQLQRALTFEKQKGEAVDRARYIAQGNLMSKSSLETQLAATTIEELAFARALYLDSIEYIVRGLPPDLTDPETHRLRETVCALSQKCRLETRDLGPSTGAPRTQQAFVALCRGTATVIKISIPRVKQGIASLIEFENRHHVLEKSGTLVSNSLYTVADGAAKTNIRVPDVSRVLGSVYYGLSLGLLEGYKVLASEGPVRAPSYS